MAKHTVRCFIMRKKHLSDRKSTTYNTSEQKYDLYWVEVDWSGIKFRACW